MTVAHALRTALVTAALAGAAVLGTHAVAQADAPVAPGTQAGAPAVPQATPSPTPSADTNPWD
ncbi:hypothetical protein [Streptomyces sp. NPDC051567]|uniref:hypothetical protein n=1 Tax=Streptomyces sp. NPDC051567 TaxID=3365660 RepID=UPI0037AC63B3